MAITRLADYIRRVRSERGLSPAIATLPEIGVNGEPPVYPDQARTEPVAVDVSEPQGTTGETTTTVATEPTNSTGSEPVADTGTAGRCGDR